MAILTHPSTPFRLLRERDFSLLLFGQFISALGDKLHYIALGVIVYQLTGSALEVGKVTLATFAPYLLFGLVAGAYVDRWNKKWTMILADCIRVLLVALIPFLIHSSLNFIYLLTFLITSANLFFSPAKMSIIPSIFSKEDILPATSLSESIESATEIIGYTLAGMITLMMTIEYVFFWDALSFFISAVSIFAMRFRDDNDPADREASESKPQIFREIREGLSYVHRNKALAKTLLTYCIVLLLFSGFNPLVFVYALKTLGTTPVGLGMLEASAAIGMTFGGLILSFWGTRFSKNKIMLSGYLISGVTIAILGLFPWYPLALIGFFFTGVSNIMFLIPVQSLFQEETAAEMRGRVFSARYTLTRIAYMLSVLVLSFTANQIGVQLAYVFSGSILTLMTLYLFTRSRLTWTKLTIKH